MLPTLSPQEFVAKWRSATLKERSAAQEHFIDVCRLTGQQTPAEADPAGTSFSFEYGAGKERGGQGWADVWKKGCFAWEYKGKRKDLDAAYRQLLQYRESLLNPPLLIVSDMERIVIHTNFTNTVKQVIELSLDDLLRPERLALLRAAFAAPETFRLGEPTELVTQKAAASFAQLADRLRKYGEDPQRTAHFLIRLLFCLFAEDVGLLPEGLFTRLIGQARRRPQALAEQLRQLFAAMAKGGFFGADEIAHFDGRLFDDDRTLALDADGLEILARVSALSWSSIEPSILGTLFVRSLDPAKRSQLGAHYTSEEDILLVVEPVLMAPLRRRWAEVRAQALELARRRDQAAPGQARTRRHAELEKLLLGFAQELAGTGVLDAACGSGDFLYVALKLLLDLWKEVSLLAADLGLARMLPLPGLAPSPEQLHGIEIDEYARELAQATIWIGYIQWLHDNGFGLPSEPILKPLDNIRRMDAILARDEAGRPAEPEWPAADVLVGNPPFLGGNKIRQELGDTYVTDLFALYEGRVPALADLVCYWFEKARAMIEAGKIKRAGLLATQGIRGGANRRVLERIKETGDIFWAWDDRVWILDGAAVQISMIGFDNGQETDRTLNGQPVEEIHANLTRAANLTQARALEENLGLAFRGNQKGGPFDISGELARTMLAAPVNLNGRPNADVVKCCYNGMDITRQPRDIWLIDFGTRMTMEEAAAYEMPFEYILQHVYPVRKNNRRKAYRERWWIHAEARPSMRAAIGPLERYIATPHVSKHRIFAWLTGDVIPDHELVVIARQDDYFFGVLHSKVHELWARGTGTQLREVESGFRYTPTTTFETFPFPWPPGQEPAGDPRVEAIAEAARELVDKRGRWLNPEGAAGADLERRTLTNLYNQRPAWLELAHRKLDEAVLDAYGWPRDLGDEEALARLLALNLERSQT